MEEAPFWKRKSLAELSQEEWESLCDGCGLCCLQKLEDEDDGTIYFTRVACKLLDLQSCRCRDYANRQQSVSDCIKLEPQDVAGFGWLPPTCAYRLRSEGKDLHAWHYLVSGDRQAVHREGISRAGRMIAEGVIAVDRWQEQVIFMVPRPSTSDE